jgi:hypothetical protein
VFRRVVERSEAPRAISVHLVLPPDEGRTKKVRVPLWSCLSLELLPIGHVDVHEGVFAWSVRLFSGKEDGGHAVQPTSEPAHGITADVVAAFHVRSLDNSGPNAPGPGNRNAPGKLRIVR